MQSKRKAVRAKDVWISIKGRQFNHPYETESMEIVTSGSMSREDDDLVVSYDEGYESGLGNTRTTLLLNKDRVTLLRSGDVISHMIFEAGRRHVSYYDMEDAAPLTIGVDTRRMKCDIRGTDVDVEMEYTVEVGNAFAGVNIMNIHVSQDLNQTPDPKGFVNPYVN